MMLWISMGMMGCNTDKGLTIQNSVPTAEIFSHSEGDRVLEGSVVTLKGSVTDLSDRPEQLTVVWYVGQEVVCEATAPQANGETECQMILAPDTAEIMLEVKDPDNARGEDRVVLTVVETEQPVAEILSPVPEGVYYANQLLSFSGVVSDAEDDPSLLQASWSSNVDNLLSDVNSTPDENGELLGYTTLTEGQHAIELLVEDTMGKTSRDSVIITVGPPNSSPSCSIVAPSSGAIGMAGDTVLFRGEVADVDVVADWLSVVWKSDKDGELGSSTPTSTGEVLFSVSDLSVNDHTITMLVTDEMGATCSTASTYTVGTPPEIVIDAPLDGEIYNEGETLLFQVTVSDERDSPEELILDWSVDGISVSAQGALASGVAQYSSSGLALGVYSLVVTATDTDGFRSSEQRTFSVNGAPSAPVVSISPADAKSGDDLTVNIDTPSVDPEGAVVVYSYEWVRNNIVQVGLTTSSISASLTSKDDIWTARVRPSDGQIEGVAAEASVLIQNTPPSLEDISIQPSTGVHRDTSLSCSVTIVDPDELVTPSFQWTIDGAEVGSTSTLDLATLAVLPNDEVLCAVSAADAEGEVVTGSTSVTIENRPPTVTSVILPSGTLYTDDTITVSVLIADDDQPDVGTLTSTYEWHVIDVSQSGQDREITTVTDEALFGGEPSRHFEKGDRVYVIVTPNDTMDFGAPVSSNTVEILNSPPETPVISLERTTSDSASVPDELTCLIEEESTDADSEDENNLTYSYSWIGPDGAPIQGATLTSDLSDVLSVMIFEDEIWSCEVTPSDGEDEGIPAVASIGELDADGDGVSVWEDCDDSDPYVQAVGTGPNCPAQSCASLLNEGHVSLGADGVYWIRPNPSEEPFEVYCDMTYDEGGWTLLAKFSSSGIDWNWNSNNWSSSFTFNPIETLNSSSDIDARGMAWSKLSASSLRLTTIGSNSSTGPFVIFSNPRPTAAELINGGVPYHIAPTAGDMTGFALESPEFEGTAGAVSNTVSINAVSNHSAGIPCCDLLNRVRIGSTAYAVFTNADGAANAGYVGVGGSAVFRDGDGVKCCAYPSLQETYTNTSGDGLILWGK